MEYRISNSENIDFLCFYLLGVTQADIGDREDNDLLLKCANRAYLDLNRTLKFKKVSKEDKDNYKKLQSQKSSFREGTSIIIRDNIADLLRETPENYDKWHKETCEKVIEKANEYDVLQEKLYHGQAQKWVNMTIKYIWVTEKWKNKLDRLMNVLHVPVDSYILQGVWEDETLKLEDKKAILYSVSNEKGKERLKASPPKFNDQSVYSWSKWDYEQYKDFQTNLRKKLEGKQFAWEGETWIKIAKERAHKQKDY